MENARNSLKGRGQIKGGTRRNVFGWWVVRPRQAVKAQKRRKRKERKYS